MNCSIFKAASGSRQDSERRNLLTVPETMYKEPLKKIIESIDPLYLEDAVASVFDDILPYRKVSEIKYFKRFPQWEEMFKSSIYDFLEHLNDIDDFKAIISEFPDIAEDIYIYLLENYIRASEGVPTKIDMDIIEDILIPMSDMEKGQNYYFGFLRKQADEILDSAPTFEEMWDILQVFEQYYPEINRKALKPFFDNCFKEVISYFGKTNEHAIKNPDDNVLFDDEDLYMLMDFFMDKEAYDYFMDNLPNMLHTAGIELYSLVLKIVGPTPEVTASYHHCKELYDFA